MNECLSIAIHVSAQEVRTVVARQSKCEQFVEVMAIGVAKNDGFCHGKILHRDKLISAIKTSVQKAEDMRGFRIKSAIIVLDSIEMRSNSRGAEIYLGGKTIEANDMVSVLSRVKKELLTDDGYYLVQFMMQGACLDDGYMMKSVVGMDGAEKMSVFYHLMGLPNASCTNMSKVFIDSNIPTDGVIFGVVAGAEYALMPEEKQHGVLFVDIGASSTVFCVYNDDMLLVSGFVAMGGDDVTKDIAKEAQIDLNEAEIIKHYDANLIMQESDLSDFINIQQETRTLQKSRLVKIVEARYRLIFNEIQEQLEDQEIELSRLQRGVVLAGGGSQIQGIVSYLKKHWKTTVHIANSNPKIIIYKPSLSNENIKYMDKMIAKPHMQTVLGAMLYHYDDEFCHQRRIDLPEDSNKANVNKIPTAFNKIASLIKKIF